MQADKTLQDEKDVAAFPFDVAHRIGRTFGCFERHRSTFSLGHLSLLYESRYARNERYVHLGLVSYRESQPFHACLPARPVGHRANWHLDSGHQPIGISV